MLKEMPFGSCPVCGESISTLLRRHYKGDAFVVHLKRHEVRSTHRGGNEAQ